MEKGFYKYYKYLPAWAKGIVVVGGAFVGYLAVTSILNKIKADKEKAKSEAEVTSAQDDLSKVIKSGVSPTLTTSVVESMSNAIVTASNDCGTNNNMIYAQFDKIKNEADVLLFVKVFGLRKKVRCPFSDDPRESFMSNLTPALSLSAMLHSEMSTPEIQTINDKLAAKGIKYQF